MRHLLIVFLVSAILLSLAPTTVSLTPSTASTAPTLSLYKREFTVTAFISPVLLDDRYWVHGAYVEDEELLSIDSASLLDKDIFKVVNGNEEPLGRVLILLRSNVQPVVLKGKVRGILGVYPTHVGYLVYAIVSKSDLEPLSRTPGVQAILPDVRLDAVINKQLRVIEEALDDTLVSAQYTGSTTGRGSPYHYTVEITGAQRVWDELGFKGDGVKIAIIDTGVDYGSPALGLSSIARSDDGIPLIFDVSSLGLVLTPAPANPTGDGYVLVDFSQLYVFIPPYYVIKWNDTILYISVTGCANIALSLTAPALWYIGDLEVASGRFGLLFQTISASVGGTSTSILYSIPVLLVDSEGDGVYDSLYVDTTTSLYLLSSGLRACGVTIPGVPSTPDYSFADELKITYGNEVIARDLNGDGVTDYSVGALAGYVYDAAFAILLEKIGAWRELLRDLPFGYGYTTLGGQEIWSGEPVALIWPGLDGYGDYAVIAYDYHSHGTFCATTAAGRDYFAETGYGVRSLRGQAPEAKIAAAPALYMGTIFTAIYFFTGFDIETPYGVGSRYLYPILATNPWIAFDGYTWRWVYTGKPLVDMTSNSYGISGWALWGWASGMDPASIVFDYTTLVSRVPHFVAVGNGGPGWGTVASPASSTLAISVGAVTEFTYRPLYGYAWPGSSRQVISWSNRGPTELGVVKPDIVAVGSFAWAVGRTWEALGGRTLNGGTLHALFSGTSQATPMAAGVGALVVSAYKAKTGSSMPAHLLKTILMNTANDMGFDELSQGSGFVDAYEAVMAVLNPRYPRVYSTSIINDMLKEIGVSFEAFTETMIPEVLWFEPKIFIPEVSPGRTALRTLIIEGRGTYTITPVRLVEKSSLGLCDAVIYNLNPTIITRCSGEDLILRVLAASAVGHLIIDVNKLREFDYLEIQLVYPYGVFEAGGRTGSLTQRIGSSIIELAYWIDVRADGVFSWLETARIMYDIRAANSLRIQIGDLEGQLREIEELAARYMGVDVSTLPKYLVVRIGVSGATYRGDIPIKARIVGYTYERWDDVRVAPSRLHVSATGRVVVTVRGPTTPGFYSGYILVEEARQGFRTLVPLSFFVPLEVSRVGVSTALASAEVEKTLYKNFALRGAFDYGWRYESGDWRVFKIKVSNLVRDAWALAVKVTWPVSAPTAYASNVDVHVYGPFTYYMVNEAGIVETVKVNGLQLAAELTIDPTLRAGQNPRRFWDSIAPGYSAIVTPVSRGETYRVVVRNIQFSGMRYEENISLEFNLLTARASVEQRSPRVYLVRITLRGAADTLPIGVAWQGEVLIKPDDFPGLIYGPADYIHTELLSYTVSRDTVTVVLRIHVSEEAPSGTYTIPLLFHTPIPVTTVGYTEVQPTIVEQWNYIPFMVNLVVK